MLIGRDDISNDIINLGASFHLFFNVCYIRAGFHFMLIGGNLTAQSTGSYRGIGGRIQISEMQLQAVLPLPALRCQSALENLLAGYFSLAASSLS